ncbi:ABC transporter permease [Rahnella sp. SAP-1]|jgi:peptide/nickel transport system permease protein|uniref:ABC transporter permease n=1 Tax=Rouxiella aceris TaxID=2703884 RepID=A0A848MGH8_9GAMM|nr:ABC transporter permease [Rouxiella aceris]NMP26765.1 ABC transporter permease [Rouxiella aceris]
MPALRPTAILGLTGLFLFLFIALFAPWLAPYAPDKVVAMAWQAPDAVLRLGTDNLGRDLLSRMIWGTRVSLGVTALAALVAFGVGCTLGFMAGLLGGWQDQLISRVNDMIMAIPTLIFALIVLAVLPKSILTLTLVLGLLESTRVLRVARALAVDIGVMEFVDVARLRGESLGWILWRVILPNARQTLIAEFGLRFIFILLFLSALSFLGLGIQPPTADWGGLARDNKDGILFGVWAALVPGGAIAVLALAINAVADWLMSGTTRNWGGHHG